jgi:hypothetical protein
MAVTMPTEDKWQFYCQEKWDLAKSICLLEEFLDVWAKKGPPGLAHNHVPIMVDLKSGALPVRQGQYPVPWEACLRIQTHPQWLKDTGIVINCQLPWNTPLLPIKKAGGDDYQPVQDLWAVNKTVITLNPVVPTPYSPEPSTTTSKQVHLPGPKGCFLLSPPGPS